MHVFENFKEVKAAIGTEVGVSEWLDLTQKRIDQFAEAATSSLFTSMNSALNANCQRRPQSLTGCLRFHWHPGLSGRLPA